MEIDIDLSNESVQIRDHVDQHLIEGALNMLNNSLSLFESAETLAETENYGHATALLVLASEEAIKAIFYYSKAYSINIDPENDAKYSTSHNLRLNLAKLLVIFTRYSSEISNDNPEIDIEEGVYKVIHNIVSDIKGDNLSSEVKGIKDWWVNANKYKQMGLYVDENEKHSWNSPADVSLKDYKENVKFVEPIINGARIIRIFQKRGIPDEIKGLNFDRLIDHLKSEYEEV